MSRYILRKLVTLVPVLFFITFTTFAIAILLPGDPALAMLGEERVLDKQAYEAARKELGLDQPLPVQYLRWLGKAVQGDFGMSIRSRQPVLEVILEKMPATLELGFLSLLVAVAIGLPAGIISATRPNSGIDTVSTLGSLVGVALPHFWLGVMLIYLFSVVLRLLPASGFVPLLGDPGTNLRLMVLPALTLGTGLAAIIMRQVRSALLDVLQQEYVNTARAKGLPEGRVIRQHALRNALIPVVTIIGLQISRVFGGAVVVETIFAIPGVGRLAADSMLTRDFPMLQGTILFLALAVLVANLLTDILYGVLDPRISYG
ncbi:MAG: ABC transporter permease [Dehalococcoidia bacterium]